MSKNVAVLFARADSVYKTLPDCDVYDIDRDARKWPGGTPCIAHPPCRLWATLAHMATRARPDEKELAFIAVQFIRANGGVLEHPIKSKLWKAAGLPGIGERDEWGGFTLQISQWCWGHKADKPTRLYVCGCKRSDVPPMPFRQGPATHVVNTGHGVRKGSPAFRPHCTKREREATPPPLAQWLVELAKRCRPPIRDPQSTIRN